MIRTKMLDRKCLHVYGVKLDIHLISAELSGSVASCILITQSLRWDSLFGRFSTQQSLEMVLGGS
jgi:hypothetical protein